MVPSGPALARKDRGSAADPPLVGALSCRAELVVERQADLIEQVLLFDRPEELGEGAHRQAVPVLSRNGLQHVAGLLCDLYRLPEFPEAGKAAEQSAVRVGVG